MSTEENKTIARRFRETMDKSKGAGLEEFVAPQVVMHFPGSPPLNREQVQGLVGVFYSAFTDLYHIIEDQIAEGDKVVNRITLRGTHKGDFQGIPPTGKEVAFPAIVIDRFEGGKIVEHWSSPDMMGLMQQLGVVPAPGQGGS
ncbi:ester cyclase [candidate division KSB1 bacterium]|nr:ester cyclase [candidate division KSB1 bacterium]